MRKPGVDGKSKLPSRHNREGYRTESGAITFAFHHLRLGVFPLLTILAVVLSYLFRVHPDTGMTMGRRNGMNSTLRSTLAALEALSRGNTNECASLLQSPDYVTGLNKNGLVRLMRSASGRKILRTILTNDVFMNAIPDVMSNPLEFRPMDDNEIDGLVAVLCKRNLIKESARDQYLSCPERANLHEAYFTFMEMSVLRHIVPDCDTREYEQRCELLWDKFTSRQLNWEESSNDDLEEP